MTGTGLVMPVDYYPNRCQEELEAMLTAVQERQTKGAVFFTTGAGIQSQRSFQGSSRVEVEIRRILYSLHLKNSADYPNDPYAGRIRRTRARYV